MPPIAQTKPRSKEIHWKTCDAANTGFPSAFFDSICGISCIHYFSEVRRAELFREVFRLLKPGGVLVMDTEFEEMHASLWIAEFFPFLRERYRRVTLSTAQYKQDLKEAGFIGIQTKAIPYPPTEPDSCLRHGQHKPALYDDETIRAGMPVFKQMRRVALNRGLIELRRAIKDGSIKKIVQRYEKSAKMKGDIGFLIAKRPE